MTLKLKTPPAVEPVTAAEAKLHCRIDTDADDTLIASLIKAAREYCEGFQRRAYITQIWELWLDAFPVVDFIEIPRPPLQTIASIKYYDTGGLEAPFEDFFADINQEPGRAVLNYGKSWPSITLKPASGVKITFTAGYGSAAAAVPQKVKQAILLLVGAWYEQREDFVLASQPLLIPKGVEALLWQERNF
jgi:uncharacterized phiE125 gp8 family phage protein